MAAISTCFDQSGKPLGNRGASMYEPVEKSRYLERSPASLSRQLIRLAFNSAFT